ncbi:MFS transporter [Streptomyces sp. Li-HN-5-11]|uniref:MFS transporter n=1 Tax=Streptomyces sp. Li-HN-5-11 TaxID=3075432 RepID=UPI0028AC9719|nr:MFS transporter [Streptomyces sp. Li-HN-5-11]WNM29066.1 MFS transporter [Streptomyces sp. Li-HN-5-11]
MNGSSPDQQTRRPTPLPRTGSGDVPHSAISAASLGLLATPTALSANATTMTLPGTARDIGVSVSTATWIATVFGLAVAVSTPLTAALLRHRGVRAAVLTSAALVAVGTVAVAVSESMPGLLVGRAAQALGGSGLVTTAINLAGTPRRMGVVTAGSGMCGALGPLAGSLLSDHASWHVALSLSALALLAVPYVALRTPAPVPEEARASFDAVGAALTVALICALVFLARFPVAALTCAVVLGIALAAWIRREPDGFVPSALLRSPAFLTASGVVCALSTAYFALLYTVPRLLEDNAGWGPSGIGVGSLVALLVGSMASWVMAASAHRMRRSAVLTALLTLGVLAPITAAVAEAPVLLLAAAGVAVFVAASGQATLSVVAADGVPEPQRPTALGLFTLCYQLGGAFGPAIAALLPS